MRWLLSRQALWSLLQPIIYIPLVCQARRLPHRLHLHQLNPHGRPIVKTIAATLPVRPIATHFLLRRSSRATHYHAANLSMWAAVLNDTVDTRATVPLPIQQADIIIQVI